MTQDPEPTRDETTFLIPYPNVERFRKKLNSLARRAKKLGMAGFSSVDLGEHVEHCNVTGPGGVETRLTYRYRRIMVTGERPKLNGWKLLGSIAHEASGNVFSNAPGEEIPEEYRDTKGLCDHCKTLRQRRDTMIIEKDGEVRQIGRNCLQDFIGDVNIKGITQYYKTWPSLADFVGGMGGGVSRDYVSTLDYMAAVACAIRHFGFVSSTTAKMAGPNERVSATRDVAWEILFPNSKLKDKDRPPEIETEDRDAAADIIVWADEELGKRNLVGYLANLRVALTGGWLRFKHSGLAASAFRAQENDILGQKKAEERRKAMEDRRRRWAEERANEKNEFFGDVKQRAVWTLKVIKVKEFEGGYGLFYWILFKDPEGRMCVATTTKDEIANMFEKDQTFLVRGTIKKHETWDDENNTRCTYLNRIKVEGKVLKEGSDEKR